MGYKILLFDLDDTLLDFTANEIDSLHKLFEQKGYSFTEEVSRIYHSVNKQLWADYENGKIAISDVINTRFSETMARLGESVDGAAWDESYREHLSNGFQMIDGALEVCRKLSATHRLFIITNGVAQTQIKRLKFSGLYDFFEDIFISQNIGYQKPSLEFFDYVMEHIEGFNKKDALIIGDTLNSDIKGGILSGIDTCWMNRKAIESSREIHSTYTIRSLEELYAIV